VPDRTPSAASPRVISMRSWLAARRRFDDLRRLRPWGVGSVVQHPVKVGEGRFDDGQLRIERAWPDA
jgi:hypothetical protein